MMRLIESVGAIDIEPCGDGVVVSQVDVSGNGDQSIFIPTTLMKTFISALREAIKEANAQ
jgi:hypothetical protein